MAYVISAGAVGAAYGGRQCELSVNKGGITEEISSLSILNR